MKKMQKTMRGALPTAFFVLGAGAVSAGIGWMYPPAGVVSAGFFSLITGWLLILGGRGEER